MFTFAKRIGFLAMAGLVALAVATPAVHAQGVAGRGTPVAGFQPFYQLPSGINIQQLAYNTALMGRAYSFYPNAAFPQPNPIIYNQGGNIGPLGQGGYNPFLYSGNPYAAMYSNPYGASSPYGGQASMTSSGSYSGGSGYGYPGSYYPDPIADYMNGAANLIGAEGRFLIQRQQAHEKEEDVKRMKIDNRRKSLEQYLWELNNLPTTQDYRVRTQKMELARALTDPPPTELWSGKSLNDILADIKALQGKGLKGPQVTVDEDTLRHLNFTAGNGSGNIGLIKNEGRLNWPPVLAGPEFKEARELVKNLLPQAVTQVADNNTVDPGTLNELNNAVRELEKARSKNLFEMTTGQSLQAKKFIRDLEDGLKVLAQPDAASLLNMKLQARTVGDLVQVMIKKGLRFAPAVPGDEAAYAAIQQALATYDVVLNSQSNVTTATDK